MPAKLIALLLGAWIGGTLLMWLVATANFRTVERVLSRPSTAAGKALDTVPAGARRPVLRYVVSELNRFFFRVWGLAQIGLAVGVLALFLKTSPRNATDVAIAGVLLGLVVVMTLVITPVITSIGRAMDFLPRETPPPQMALFGRLHAAYSAMDLLKLVLASILAWRLRGT